MSAEAIHEEKPPVGGDAGGGAGADPPSKLLSVYKSATGFMALVGKEWLSSLINQPADPPFSFNTTFPDGPVRIMRLVVMTVVLTGLVMLSGKFLTDSTPTLVVTMAVYVVISTFLAAIVYGVFAFVCGVRVRDLKPGRLTLGQVFFTVLYIFVPWIPIFAFLWIFAISGGPPRLLLLTLLFYLSLGYAIVNFTRALKKLTDCSLVRVWLSVLLPLALAVGYIIFRL